VLFSTIQMDFCKEQRLGYHVHDIKIHTGSAHGSRSLENLEVPSYVLLKELV